VKPWITDVLPLARAADAHRIVEAGRSVGRVLLAPGR
jgi:hypothetical protein